MLFDLCNTIIEKVNKHLLVQHTHNKVPIPNSGMVTHVGGAFSGDRPSAIIKIV